MDLTEIWSLNDSQLEIFLSLKGQKLTNNKNFDRVVASVILYNEGQLETKSQQLVENPKFSDIMSTGSFKDGLDQLDPEYRINILEIDQLNAKVSNIMFEIETSGRFNDQNLSKNFKSLF